ncbi:hypothetical protein CYMTET_19038 [Cymbomonas tetramitiformis]|uniref:Uncharacterized protein n=1 Tax=Cymbomonas tetramitiformis TaxID=36881 RepID=A0AAE0G6Z4_9CHLO|nr:hypothetical protein CYMTET_19038 [Cymbomonas tetramitiformis]
MSGKYWFHMPLPTIPDADFPIAARNALQDSMLAWARRISEVKEGECIIDKQTGRFVDKATKVTKPTKTTKASQSREKPSLSAKKRKLGNAPKADLQAPQLHAPPGEFHRPPPFAQYALPPALGAHQVEAGKVETDAPIGVALLRGQAPQLHAPPGEFHRPPPFAQYALPPALGAHQDSVSVPRISPGCTVVHALPFSALHA